MATYLDTITAKLNLMLAKVGIVSTAEKTEFKAYGASTGIIRTGSAFDDSMNQISP